MGQSSMKLYSQRRPIRQLRNIDEVRRVNTIEVVRFKPVGLDILCKNTKFSRKELQVLYRGFKQDCPSGIVSEEMFMKIYSEYFPHGDSSGYARLVFNTFDQDSRGSISFDEFVTGLSVLCRGSTQQRLQWAFTLYDINGDGVISKDEMLVVLTAVYKMMGPYTMPCITPSTVTDHLNKVFLKMDLNCDGVISVDEFMSTCTRDEIILQGLTMLDKML